MIENINFDDNSSRTTNSNHSAASSSSIDLREDTQRLLNLLVNVNKFPEKIKDLIEDRAGHFFGSLAAGVVDFISHDLNAIDHEEKDLKRIIEYIPESLAEYDPNGTIAIVNVCHLWCRYHNTSAQAYPFIPLLAREGLKLCSQRWRGGLLCKYLPWDDNNNALQYIFMNDKVENSICLDIIKRLRSMGLILKNDIRKYKLLLKSCSPQTLNRFHYLLEWDPGALKHTSRNCNYNLYGGHGGNNNNNDSNNDSNSNSNGEIYFLNTIASIRDIEYFEIALNATLKYFPYELGLLLLESTCSRHEHGTAYGIAIARYGEKKAWNIVTKCIDEAEAEAGNLNQQILERNPKTNLYPFMEHAAAVGGCPLNLIYYLIRKRPEVVTGVDHVRSDADLDVDVDFDTSPRSRSRCSHMLERDNDKDVNEHLHHQTLEKKRKYPYSR